MKDYLVRELLNEMNEDKLELIDLDSMILTKKIATYTALVDVKYENKLRDAELINAIESYNDKLTNLINRINDVEVHAIKNKQEELMFICESKKASLINLMMYLQNKYL